MLDAGAGRHPLGRAVGDEAAAARRVLVLEGAVDDVRHGLEAAVRVPGRALGLARGVLHGAHVVEQQERVGQRQVDARERPPYDEPLAFDWLGAVTTFATGRQAVSFGGRDATGAESGCLR